MRISFISQYFHPEQFSNNSIAQELVRRGHSIKATVSVPNYPTGKFFDGYSNRLRRSETWQGIEIERVRTLARGKSAFSLVGNYLSYAVSGSIAVVKSAHKPDVIFASEPSPVTLIIPAIVQKWRRRVPLVCWVQDIWPESAIYTLNTRNKLLIGLLHSMSGWIYRRADIVLIQSPAFRPMLERFGIESSKIHVFPNTAPDGFKPQPRGAIAHKEKLGDSDAFYIMFAGNIGESQDFETIIAAAKLLHHRSKLQWVIAGSGRHLPEVKRQVQASGVSDRITFLGRLPEENMPGYFAYADAMLISLKNRDIFSLTIPYKLQCYMACGRPIIASLAGEAARTIKIAKAGLVASPGAPEELARSIVEMMDMETKKREQMGRNGRQYFLNNFAPKVIYDRLENWLIDAAARRHQYDG